MKRAFKVVFVLLVIVVAAVVVAPSFVDLNSYKKQAINQVNDRTGLTLNLDGDLSVMFLPSPHFSASNVSLDAPEGSRAEKLLAFERLDINVEFLPLLQGQVQVSSVTLIKPVISLEKLENGSLNVFTNELQAMMQGSENNTSSRNGMPSVSLDKIHVKDGVFSYFDHKSKSETAIQNINADFSSKSLLGPYAAEGSLFYDGYALNFDLESEAYDTAAKMISPKVKFTLQPYDISVEYSGIISMSEEVSAQGYTAVRIENPKDFLSDFGFKGDIKLDDPLQGKGLLTADAKKIDYKDFEMQLGSTQLNGSVRVDLKPLKYSLRLKTSKDIKFQEVVAGDTPFEKGAFDFIIAGDHATTTIKNSVLFLDGQQFKLSGKYQGNKKTKRPEIELNVQSQLLDYDKISSGMKGGSAGGGSVSDMLSSLALPVDLSLSLNTNELVWNKRKIKDLDVSAKFLGNGFSLENLQIKNVEGASVKASLSIKDIHSATGIVSYVDIASPNILKTAQGFGLETGVWPQNFKKARIKAKLSGSLDSMNMTANIDAMNGEVIAKGNVSKPAAKPALSDLVLQVKHKNMAQLVNILTGGQLSDRNLSKPLDFYTKVNQSGNNYSLSDIKGDLSGITVHGDLEMNLGGNTPKVKGDLTFGSINLDSVLSDGGGSKTKQASAQKAAKGSNQAHSGASRWSKDPIDTSIFHGINADIALKAKKIDYGVWPLLNPSLKVALQDGRFKISDLKAGVFGGQLSLSTSIQSVDKPRQPLYFESEMVVKNADLGPLSTALIGAELVDVSGRGNLDLTLKAAGSSPAALIYDLSGKGNVTGSSIILDGVDVTQFARALSEESKAGDSVLALWSGANQGGSSQFDTLDGVFEIVEGVVQIQKMDLDGSDAAIETRGNINLPQWNLNTKHKIIVKGTEDVPSDVPPFEVSFSGSLDNPAQTFGQGLLQDYLNRKIQRKFNKLLSDKLGKPANDKSAPQNQQPAAGPDEQQGQDPAQQTPQKDPDIEDIAEDIAEEALKGILDGLLQ